MCLTKEGSLLTLPLKYRKYAGDSVMEMHSCLDIYPYVCVFLSEEEVTYVYRTPVRISLHTVLLVLFVCDQSGKRRPSSLLPDFI